MRLDNRTRTVAGKVSIPQLVSTNSCSASFPVCDNLSLAKVFSNAEICLLVNHTANAVQVNNTVELKFLASLSCALLMCEISLSEEDKE